MKNAFVSILALAIFSLSNTATQAQTSADEAAVKSFWNETWQAFDSGNTEKMWAAYTDNAGEIGPDGHLTTGKAALRESWEAFMKMVDEQPKFTYADPAVRILTPDVALITWDSRADIKMGGQQVGGSTKGMAVVRKIKGQWMIEFDSLTPVLEMPAGN